MPAAIVIPTRRRAAYLEVALAGVMPQAAAAGVPVVVVDDADPPDPATARACARAGARCTPNPRPGRGINGARNHGTEATDADLLLFLDDDVRVGPGWLRALLDAAAAYGPEVGFLTGPVHAAFEGHASWTCGRERPPITTFDAVGDVPRAWGVNLAVRRAVLDRVGPWDERLVNGGDEEALQAAFSEAVPEARVVSVPEAWVLHRRAGDDARLRSLCRATRARGQAARRFDVSRGVHTPLRAELTVLAGCLGHVVRYLCPNGLTMAAHALGRCEEAWRPSPAAGDDFLSGASGTVGGLRGRVAGAVDGLLDLELRARRSPPPSPRRRVLVLGIERPDRPNTMAASRAELQRSAHDVEVRTTTPGDRGKFENLNELLAAAPLGEVDWLLVVDDDVALPRGFLDGFLARAERDGLALAQPAHRRRSHAAWPHTRRRRTRRGARPTTFVEIGPVTAFHRPAFELLLPFPAGLRMGWGLDAAWSAAAAAAGLRLGIVDATPVGHVLAPVGAGYGREEALAEARAFLADRPYVTRAQVR